MSLPRRASARSDAVMRSCASSSCKISPLRMIVTGFPKSSLAYFGQNQTSVEFRISRAVIKKIGTRLAESGRSGSSMQMDATLEISSVVTSSAGCSSPSWRLPISRMATTTARYTSTVRTTEEIIPAPPHKFPQRRPHYPA